MPKLLVPVMLPELVTSAEKKLAKIPLRPPTMLPPALLVTVALLTPLMPKLLVPVMLPELVTSAKGLLAKIPLRPPAMLPPALLVTVALSAAINAVLVGAGDAAGIGDIGKTGVGVNSKKDAGDAGAGIVGHRRGAEKDAVSGAGDCVAGAGDNIDGNAGLDAGAVAVNRDRRCVPGAPAP